MIPDIPEKITGNNGRVWCKSCECWEVCHITRTYAAGLNLRYLRRVNIEGSEWYLYTDREDKMLALPHPPRPERPSELPQKKKKRPEKRRQQKVDIVYRR